LLLQGGIIGEVPFISQFLYLVCAFCFCMTELKREVASLKAEYSTAQEDLHVEKENYKWASDMVRLHLNLSVVFSWAL